MQVIAKDPEHELEFTPFRAPAWKWFMNRAEKGLPALPALLEGEDPLRDNRIVSDITPEPFGVRYREVGSVLETLYGKPLAGKTVDELYNDWFRKRIYEGYKTAVKEKLPVYVRRGISTALLTVGYHQLLLPCGEKDATQMVSYIIPLDDRIRTRQDWEKAVKESPWF